MPRERREGPSRRRRPDPDCTWCTRPSLTSLRILELEEQRGGLVPLCEPCRRRYLEETNARKLLPPAQRDGKWRRAGKR